jgi:osmotically-inducible protein OsmY
MLPTLITQTNSEEGLIRCRESKQGVMEESAGSQQSTKTDEALVHAVASALWKDHVLRTLEYSQIEIFARNGIVYLSGHIVSAISQSRIKSAIQTVPDILGIRNNLVLDDKLVLDIASSLGNLEHTYHCKFFTGASHGVISLNGVVRDETVKLLAEQCVASHPHVRGVINNVQVTGIVSVPQEQLFLQPVIGEPVYFLDGVFGTVKQVIIDRINRRVVQFVLQGRLSSQKQNSAAQKNNQSQIPEKVVVIPIQLIRYLTTSSGFLTIKSTDITQYQDFNPLYFAVPPMDWTPPYPYCPEDVLFHIDIGEIENQIMVDPDILQLNISAQPTSLQKTAIPVDILASWEDDGGQIIQTAEATH